MKPKPILTQHKYPSFINNATIFEKHPTIDKVFPKIGFPNRLLGQDQEHQVEGCSLNC